MQATDSKQLPLLRPLLVLVYIILLVAALSLAQKIFIPLAMAMFGTFLLGPAVSRLQRRGIPRIGAVLLVMFIVFAAGAIGIWLVVVQLEELLERLPEHTQNVLDKIASLKVGDNSLVSRLSDMIRHINSELQPSGPKPPSAEAASPVPVIIQGDSVPFAQFPTIAGFFVEFVATILLVLVLTIFMLVKREDLRFRLVRLVGHDRLTLTTQMLDEASTGISKFLLMQLAINAGFGVAVTVGLYCIGVPYFFMWGVVAGLLRFIPYIGAWVAMLFPLVLSFAMSPAWYQPLSIIGIFVVLEIVASNVAEPLLFSHSTGLSPIALLMAAVFWTWLWGPIGLILSAPITVCLYVIGRYVPPLNFLQVLLGAEPVLDPSVQYYERLLAQDQDDAVDVVEEFLQNEPPDAVFDRVLVPALALAKRDQMLGQLQPHLAEMVEQSTRNLIEDTITPRLVSEAAEPPENDRKVTVLGCPASDKADELGLLMLQSVLAMRHHQLTVLTTNTLAAEILTKIDDESPAAVFIACQPPGGLAKARYLCKRIRARFPDLPIVVGRWGPDDHFEAALARLKDDGANFVASSVLESANQLKPMFQLDSIPANSVPEPQLQ